MVDRIFVRDLAVNCIVGMEPKERTHRQDVVINLSLACDLAKAAQSDRIEDTLNYKTLKNEIVAFVEASSYLLIEKMADQIARLCLAYDCVQEVTVSVDKPGALTGARSVAVEITRGA